MKFCPNCGHKVNETAKFCSNCGFKLVEVEKKQTAKSESMGKSTNLKVFISDDKPEQIIGISTKKDAENVSTIESSSEQLQQQLKMQLENLYQQIVNTFSVKAKTGTLANRFAKIKLPIFFKVEGYDLDELTNRVEPLCQENHTATQVDIDFIKSLIGKYKNYFKNSNLEKQLGYLSGQSRTAIAAEKLNDLQEYMHVDRGGLERDFLKLIQGMNGQHGKLIFLVGNVGDGKSHVIGYLKQQHASLFADKNIRIHYDATESFDPQKTAIQTLTEVLEPFSDQRILNNRENWIVAINMGVLVNFVHSVEKVGNFSRMVASLNASNVFSSKMNPMIDDQVELISFRDYPLFQIDETGTTSAFYDELFNKIVQNSNDNPFYEAYTDDKESKIIHLAHRNFELFCQSEVRETLKLLLIKIQIESKVIISTRALLELIHDIIVPTQLENREVVTFRNSLPYLIFGESGDSGIIEKMKNFDPQYIQNQAISDVVSRVFNSNKNLEEIASDVLSNDAARSINWLWSYVAENLSLPDRVGILLRMKYLFEHDSPMFEDRLYTNYLQLLTEIKSESKQTSSVKDFFKKVKSFLYIWNGSPDNKENYIFTFINEQTNFGVAIPFKVKFKSVYEQEFNIVLELENEVTRKPYTLEIDYELFELIYKVNSGYLLKEKDRRKFINVSTFIEKIIQSDQALEETLIGNTVTGDFYRLTYDGMGPIELEKE